MYFAGDKEILGDRKGKMLKQNKPDHFTNMCCCIPVTKAQILTLVFDREHDDAIY